MARLGVITDEISEDFEQALAVCNDLNIREVELRSVWNTSIVEHDDDALGRIERMLFDGGFAVCGIASPFLKCHIAGDGAAEGRTHSATETTREQQWDVLARSLEVAARLDAPIVRAFSFWRIDDPESAREDILATLQEATARTAAAGKLLGLENEHACNIATGEEAAWYLERIPDATFGLIWDPGNEAALGHAPFPDGYNAVRGRIHHVHIKDATNLGEPVGFTVIGEGIIPYEDQFRLLKEDGYPGVLSLETHFNLDGGREGATRACAAATRTIAARAGLLL
ncbi:MAG TPA: sugar phosphate isomerase/epimerase family protein [Thermomicrobiales bacterium]|nr:sugar phosphate isomerase/epimerase family protein [Thermomicrobiales bacterium]